MSFLNVSPHGGNRNIRGRNVKADETVPRNQQKLPLSPRRGQFNANPSPTSSPIAGTKQNFSMHSSKRTSAVSTHYFSSPERQRGDSNNSDEPPTSSTRSRNHVDRNDPQGRFVRGDRSNENAESPVLGSRSSGIRSRSPVMKTESPAMRSNSPSMRSSSPVTRIRSQDTRTKRPVNMRTKSPVMRSMSPVDRNVECSRSYTRSDVYEKDYTRQHPESPPKNGPIEKKARIQKAPLEHAPLKQAPVPKKKSPFALLSDDICRFQKMVRELEGHLESSGMSPAAQWKCRILITSNDDLARKIDGGLSDFQLSIGQMEDRKSAGRARAHGAYMKLMRDFRRAYTGHENLSGKYQQRQIQEIRKLETKWRPEEREDNMNQPNSKDLKVMRAREAELREINKKMQTVMTIYKELGQIVGDQTEGVNKVESKINDSKQKAQDGASIFESANLGFMENWKKYLEFDEEPLTTGVERQPTFHWTMPLETFHDDMKSVQNDIFSLGNDLVGQGVKKAKDIFQCNGLQCNETGVHVREIFQCNELQCNENGGHVRDMLQCNENDVHVRSYEEAYGSFEDIRSFDITAAETETFEEEKSEYGFY
eukprot:scaffold35139_cov40-Attheya_sp.AAC.1